MIYPGERILFTVRDVSRICGVSRATLLRIEDDGFLTPYKVNQETGYRYYDANNIVEVGQFKILMGLGISREDATNLYHLKPDAVEFLKQQRQKIDRILRLMNEAEIKVNHEVDFHYNYINLPEMTCYCIPFPLTSEEDQETFAYNKYQHLLAEGFPVDVMESLFMLFSESGEQTPTLCIPLLNSECNDPHLRTFPASNAFSMAAHGGYSVIPQLKEAFQKKFNERNLKATGPARCIFLVAPYTGEHFQPNDYCLELVVPIEKDL